MEEIGLAAMLAAKRPAGVAPKVNLTECVTHMPPPSVNKAEPTLALKPRGDVTRSPKQKYQWAHKKGLMSAATSIVAPYRPLGNPGSTADHLTCCVIKVKCLKISLVV